MGTHGVAGGAGEVKTKRGLCGCTGGQNTGRIGTIRVFSVAIDYLRDDAGER